MKTVKLQAVCSVAVVAISVLWMSQGRLWPAEVRLDASGTGRSQFARFRPKSNQAVPGRYIVRLKSAAAGFPGRNSRAAAVAAQIGRDHGIDTISGVLSKYVNRFVVEIPEDRARQLSMDPRIDSVEQDTWGTILTTQYPAPWALDRLDQHPGAGNLDQNFSYEFTGAGVDVYLLDQGDSTGGIRTSHEQFSGRVSDSGINHAPDASATCDEEDENCNKGGIGGVLGGSVGCGHATNMAAVIAGSWYGVAKDTSVIYGKVVNCNGLVIASLAAQAVYEVIELHQQSFRPSVLNLSWSAGPNDDLDNAVRAAINAGITVVVAAGNKAKDPNGFSPQRVSEVILVGATTSADTRWGSPGGFESAYGPLLDLFAPGHAIVTADNSADNAYVQISGTSPAAAVVSGVAAMYLAANPSQSPSQVRDALVINATIGEINPATIGAGSPNRLIYSGFITGGPTGCPPDCPPGGSGTERLVSLRADNGQFMVAEGNGGGAVNADRNSAGPWETFTLVDLNGGDLWDGDEIGLRAGDGSYLQAVGGGGGQFLAVGGDLWAWETFRVHAESGSDGRIDTDEWLSLETFDGYYVVAEGGGGSVVNADRTSVGSWERFRLVIW